MTNPTGFREANFDQIIKAIDAQNWVLVATLDDAATSEALVDLLEDGDVQQAASNFECFVVAADSETREELEIEDSASLSIFVDSETPRFSYAIEYPEEVTVEDIIQFLDDSASDISDGDDDED